MTSSIWAEPNICSRPAAEISATREGVCWISGTIWAMRVPPSSATCTAPAVGVSISHESTASPFSAAPEEVEVARDSMRAALSAVWRMEPVISSMAEDTSSMARACSPAGSRRAGSERSRSSPEDRGPRRPGSGR